MLDHIFYYFQISLKYQESRKKIHYMDILNELYQSFFTSYCQSYMIAKFNFISKDKIQHSLLNSLENVINALSKQHGDINLLNPEQALLFLCCLIPNEYYCLCIDKVLISLLQEISIDNLFKTTHQRHFQNFRTKINKKLDCCLSNLDLLDRYFDSSVKFQKVIQPYFSLIQITLEVYHWRHLTVSKILKCNRKSVSLLTARSRFYTIVSIESHEMNMLMEEFLAQMRNIRHEIQLYRGFGYQGNRQTISCLRFVSRFSLKMRPTRGMFRIHFTQSILLSSNDKTSKELQLASYLSQMLFGNILEGQACSLCFEVYREPLPIDCSGDENTFRYGCHVLRGRVIKSLKLSKLYHALYLVVAKFLSSYDTFAIQSGLWNISFHCWYNPFLEKQNNFSRLLVIFSAFAAGITECRKSRIVQIELQQCFKSLHETWWNTAYLDYPRYAEWFLANSNKDNLIFYFRLATMVNIDCFDFATILNEMITQRQDLLRELAEEPESFINILYTLRKLEGYKLYHILRQTLDIVISWKELNCRLTYQTIRLEF